LENGLIFQAILIPKSFIKTAMNTTETNLFSIGCRPELMFQDWDYIPDFLISEYSLHQDTFKYFELTDDMDEERAEAFEIYCSSIVSWPSNGNDLDETLRGFEESYQGCFSGSMKDPETAAGAVEFTYQYIEETNMLADVPKLLERYFDYKVFASDLFFRRILAV
jgi:antirestriction protein